MFRMGKFVETESKLVSARDWDGVRGRRETASD